MIQAEKPTQRKQYVVKVVLALFLASLPAITFAQTPAGYAFEEAEALFRQNSEWLGTDGANSTSLGHDRIFWSFDDTFVATSEAHTRQQSTMIRNSVAIQTGNDPLTAKMNFYWGQDASGSPASFFPEDGDLIVTYATNSFEFGDMFTEYGKKHLYWPRVMTVKVDNQR